MSQLVAHEDVCENVEVHCSAVDLGCTTILPRRSIGEHTENCHVEKSRCFIEPLKEENIELREHLETTFDMVQRLQREVENIKRRQQLYQPKLVEKIACFCDSTIFVINTTSGAVERTLGGDTQAITCIALLDSHDIASASAPGIVKIWNVRSGTCLVTFITGTVWLMRGACSKLFTGGDANVHVYSRDPSAKKIFECDPVVCIHENGCFVTAARGVLKEYNDKGRLISEARYPAVCTIESLVKTNDGTMVTMAHQENFFRVWRKNDRTQTLSERKFHVHTDAIDCIILLSDGRIASCGKDMTVHVTEIQGETSNLSTVLRDHTDRVVSITEINPGVIVSSSRDKTIRVWNNSRCVKVIPVEHTMLGLTPYK
jgi:WD40 repeat protein